MSKIVRLTESDLVRLVKRVMKEQAQTSVPKGPVNNIGNNVWNKLKKAIEGIGTDEAGVKSACAMVTTAEIYKQLLANAKAAGNQNVMEYIMSDFQVPIVDKPIATTRKWNPNTDSWASDPETGSYKMFSTDKDTQITKFCAKTLGKFNPIEFDYFMDNIDVDNPV
jgi:hypothetical protein